MPLNPSRGETGLRGLLIVPKRRSGLVARKLALAACTRTPSKAQETSTSEHSEAREDWQLSRRRVCSSSAAQKPQRAAPQNREAKKLPQCSELSVLHQFTGALQRGRTRARGPSAYAIDAPSAISAPRHRHHRRFSRGGRRAVRAVTARAKPWRPSNPPRRRKPPTRGPPRPCPPRSI